PLFHALVLSRIRHRIEEEGLATLTIDELTEDDELEILRTYCMTLHKEYRTLRTIFLENMVVNTRTVGLKHTTN
ncbi:MAG: hypothetical protein HW407_2221, partial [Bacteroidetes bacterium]|nr:hypothetical protein [Bacteroidota bacterium]